MNLELTQRGCWRRESRHRALIGGYGFRLRIAFSASLVVTVKTWGQDKGWHYIRSSAQMNTQRASIDFRQLKEE